MQIYGYELDPKRSLDEDPQLLELESITLEMTKSDMLQLLSFLKYTIDLFETYGDSFGHEHYSDFIASLNQESDLKKMNIPDIVIIKSTK